jgi:hypothetical protein
MNEEKKAKFLEYYRKLPNQKLAAGFIGRDEDTICIWKKEDKKFADAVLKAKSDWAEEKVGRVRSQEWLLERILKDEFAQRQEQTGAGGKDLPTPIYGGQSKV